MNFHQSLLTWPLVASLLLSHPSLVIPVASFSVPPSRVASNHVISIAAADNKIFSPRSFHIVDASLLRTPSTPPTRTRNPSTTSLKMNFSPPGDNDPTGLKEGFILLAVAIVASVWIFSIPPEFRRARFCTDEDVLLYPDKKCTTFQSWAKGISEYYAGGGGVDFDFSIDPDSPFK